MVSLIFERMNFSVSSLYDDWNNIKTKNGKYFSRFAIKGILENPVYAKNDSEMYNYFVKNNVPVVEQTNEKALKKLKNEFFTPFNA